MMTNKNVKTVKLGEFVTDEMMQKCVELYPDTEAIRKQVIEPNMTSINRKLGQENDARFLSYMIVAAIEQSGRSTLN